MKLCYLKFMFIGSIMDLYKFHICLLLTLFSFVSCKEDRQIINDNQKIISLKKNLPKLPFYRDRYLSMAVTKKAHYFSNKIAFKEVKVYSSKKDCYNFIWIVDAKYTDFEELNKWKIGMILKPKNKMDFNDKVLEKKGIKTIGALTKPFLLGDEICVVLRDFKFTPKELKYIKIYLYDYNGKVNLKYWITENINLNQFK